MTDDAEHLRRYADSGSEEDFTTLVRRHTGLVYGCALRQLGDRALAEDVAQLAFIALARHARALCQRENLAGWLFTTARFLSCKMLREAGRRARREKEDIMTSSKTELQGDLSKVTEDVLCELKAVDRELILLRFYSGLRFSDISQRLSLSENAVQKRADRALQAMRDILARRGITSSMAALVAVLEAQGSVALPAGLTVSVANAALAAQAVAGPVSLSLFMAIPKLYLTAAALLLGTGIYFSAQQAHTASSLRSQITLISQRTERLREAHRSKSIPPDRSKLSASDLANTSIANPPPANAAIANVSEASSFRVTSGTPGLDPAERGRAFFEQNPAARQLWEETERSTTLVRFGPLLADLHLTADQREQFFEIMNRGRFGTMLTDNNGLFKFQHSMPLSPPEVEEGLQQLLGDQKYERYREYTRIQPVLNLAGRFTALVNSVDPIAQPSAVGLARILAEASEDYRQGRDANIKTIDWAEVMDRSRALLSPAQLSLLVTLKLQNESDRQVTEYVMARAIATKAGK